MTSSFRMSPNSAKGGETLLLSIEGFTASKAKTFVGPPCTIEIYEIDALKEKRGVSRTDDLIATFEATIAKIPGKTPPAYTFQNLRRTDTFTHTLPEPVKNRKVTDSDGVEWPLSYEPHWKPAHFSFSAPMPPGQLGPPTSHPVLMRGGKKERERYIYEIAFRILIGGTEKFTSRRNPTRLDCNNLLAHNCQVATIIMLKDHKQLVADRGVGTHYGTQYSAASDARYATVAAFNSDKTKFGLKGSNCIVYLLDAAKIGHEKTGAANDWKAIKSYMKKGDGITLAKGLEKWKWTGLYISPDTSHPRDLDWNKTPWRRNHHAYTYRRAQGRAGRKGRYKNLVVEDMIVDYFPTKKYFYWDPVTYPTFPTGVPSAGPLNGTDIAPADRTTELTTNLARLEAIPFGFINVVGGYHTAVIVEGDVYEVHWAKGPKDADLYDARRFKTWEDGFWGDGTIHVPASYW